MAIQARWVKCESTEQATTLEYRQELSPIYWSHLSSKLPKLLNPVIEGEDLSWADESEVKWVEEKHQILSCLKIFNPFFNANLDRQPV